LTVEAYFAGRSVGSITFALSPTSLDYHHADFGTIDQLVFRSDHEGNGVRFWGMVGYDAPRVPDSGLTAILLGLSVLGLGVTRRVFKWVAPSAGVSRALPFPPAGRGTTFRGHADFRRAQ
jgi:hypothetical protein